MLTTSDSITGLAAALAAVQAKIGNAVKDAKNPHFRSDYATLASVLDATRPLAEHGIAVVQAPSYDDGTVYVTTRILHGETGEWIESTLGARPTKSDPQGIGSAITYLRRYTLMAVAGIAPADDDGNAASLAPTPRRKPSGPSPKAVKIRERLTALGLLDVMVRRHGAVTAWDDDAMSAIFADVDELAAELEINARELDASHREALADAARHLLGGDAEGNTTGETP